MVSETNNSAGGTLDRILRERLEAFNVPVEVRNKLVEEILVFMQRPERKPYGSCIMTPEASIAADKARERGKASTDDAKPQIM
jgi:hypothetical protein